MVEASDALGIFMRVTFTPVRLGSCAEKSLFSVVSSQGHEKDQNYSVNGFLRH